MGRPAQAQPSCSSRRKLNAAKAVFTRRSIFPFCQCARVIIKEGRRHGETNWDGRDGYALIQHEARVLRKLRAAGSACPWGFSGVHRKRESLPGPRENPGTPFARRKTNATGKTFLAPGRESSRTTGADAFQDTRGRLDLARLQAVAHFCSSRDSATSSISREHAASIKPGCRRGVRRITPRRRLVENPPGAPEHSKMITRLASLPSNS